MRVNTVGLEQGRSTLPELAAQANAGRPTLLTRHGKPWAAIVSPEMLDKAMTRRADLLSLCGTGKGLWGDDPAKWIDEIRDEWEDRELK
ncbi:MAG: type II toxin-antitoxin system Phd/YefM family antitoxin [Burkholderiales bacterium]